MLADQLASTPAAVPGEGSFLEISGPPWPATPHRTCGGRALNDDVMDTLFTLLVNAGTGPVIRDGVDQPSRPASAFSRTLAPESHPPPQPPHTSTRRPWTDALDLDDIQAGALHGRPSPYVGTYVLLRVQRPRDGREPVRRLIPLAIRPGPSRPHPAAWITVAFAYQGLEALGVPQESLDSFAPEFRQGMAARAAELGDIGESAPEHWEAPLGGPDVHIAIAEGAPDQASLDEAVAKARRAQDEFPGIEVIWRQDCYQLPTGRTSFGFKDGIGQPSVEGLPAHPGESPIKAGATVLRNRWGTAPGFWLEGPPGLVIMLPGVPLEMRRLLEHEVCPGWTAGHGR